jgi:hypothetical protein
MICGIKSQYMNLIVMENDIILKYIAHLPTKNIETGLIDTP